MPNQFDTTFLFIRHAESEKNLRDITGGVGEELTDNGRMQACMLARRLHEQLELVSNCAIITSDAIQAKQTAEEIAKEFSIQYKISDEIAPVGLGIASGLSGEQINKEYPEISERLRAWRKQEIEAIELKIEGMEPPEQLWRRIQTFINKTNANSINIVVCTRSIMVLVSNWVLGNTPQKGGGYKHMNINHCDIIAFRMTPNINNSITVLRNITTVKLGVQK